MHSHLGMGRYLLEMTHSQLKERCSVSGKGHFERGMQFSLPGIRHWKLQTEYSNLRIELRFSILSFNNVIIAGHA